MKIEFDAELLKRHDKSGPRYTSYPTAVAFDDSFGEAHYTQHAKQSNQRERLNSYENDADNSLSLYFHIPFCDTVCFYCACNKIATKDHSRTPTYLSYLYREMDRQSALFDGSRVVEQLHWGGGTPTFLNHAEIQALMDKTRQSFNLLDDDSGDYSIEIDPRSVNRDTIALLRETGFNRFSLGVQDIHEEVQRAVNRIQSVEQTWGVIEACRENRAKSVSIDLIYGLPLQTVDGFSETLEKAIEMSPDRMSVFNYAHLPHMFKPQRRINERDLPGPGEKLAILQHTIETLTDAGYDYIGMDHFAKPTDELAIAQSKGTLHRNFQGYTTHADCDLVAMGVSSISSVNGSYCQNEKNLEGYYAALDQDRLPIIRGLSMSLDDAIRRAVIQQLSCHFRLDFTAIEEQFELRFKDYFAWELEALKPLQEDNLLELGGTEIQVTPAGRLLIRNICMVFDAYLTQHSKVQRFSKVI